MSASGDNTGSDAIGQLWYVVNADGNSNGCYYQLKDWSKRNEAAGWSIADYTTKAELQDKIDNIATADEEDITTEGDTPQTQVLKLKDRAYDSLNASGKGYKILRKNWQQINGERKNVLTQEMINEPNTIYEIRYDFDLNGVAITIPERCELKFNGGSFNNGDIDFSSLNNKVIKASKFGFIEGTDSTIAKHNGKLFQNLICSGIGIDFENREYNLDCDIVKSAKYIHIENGILNITTTTDYLFTVDRVCRNGHIELLNVTFNVSEGSRAYYIISGSGAVDAYFNVFIIKSCTFNNTHLIRLIFADYDPHTHKCGASHVIIENNSIYNTTRTFLLLANMFYGSCTIRGNYIKNNSFSIFYFGIDNDYTHFTNQENGTLLFEDNTHRNDDNFLCTSNERSYICTLLSENRTVIMKNNVFQNIRAFNSLIYAFYVSSEYFECSNNLIKNVFNFNECTHPVIAVTSADYLYNEIFKSKGSTGIIANPGIRIFDKNTVIIERENYISAMKLSEGFPANYEYYDKVMLFVRIFNPVDFLNVDMINNNINVEGIIICSTSAVPILNLKFNNNSIKFWNIKSSIDVTKLEDTLLQNNVESFIRSLSWNKYASLYEIKNNIWTCINNDISPTISLASFNDSENRGDDASSSTIIENNVGNNVVLTLTNNNSTLTYKTARNRQVIFRDNISNAHVKSAVWPWTVTEIPSTKKVLIENCPICKCTFLTKNIKLDYNTCDYDISSHLTESNPYAGFPNMIPILTENSECYKVTYTRADNVSKTLEIFKDGADIKVSSDTNVDKVLDAKKLGTLYLYTGDDIKNGGVIIRNRSDISYIEVSYVIGVNKSLKRLQIEYLPKRLNLHLNRGITVNRPSLVSNDSGFKYYDTTLGKYIVWNGTEWTNMDGSSLV